jgi:hypothetical protein
MNGIDNLLIMALIGVSIFAILMFRCDALERRAKRLLDKESAGKYLN